MGFRAAPQLIKPLYAFRSGPVDMIEHQLVVNLRP